MHWSGRIVLCMWLCAGVAQAEVRLEGDTSEPRHSLFIPGQPVVLTFIASGLTRDTTEQLRVAIEDEHAHVIREYAMPLQEAHCDDFRVRCSPAAGRDGWQWHIDLYPPTHRLGFFQAKARLSSGEALQGVCTRPPGYLTYAIVPDPGERRAFPPEETFFGMMGAVTPGILGQSWQVHNYGMYCWSAFEPDSPAQFVQKVQEYEAEEARGGWAGMPHFVGRHLFEIGGRSGSVPAYSVLPIGQPPLWAARNETRTHYTAALNREGERAFREFCLKLGRYLADKRSQETPHYYQITDEPQISWGYRGTNDELVRLFEIAYSALHEVDPHAVIAGPAFGLDAIEQLEEMLQKGLADYIDVLDFHPYMGGNVLPSEFNLVGRIRDVKELLHKYTRRPLRLTGTESGFDAKGEDNRTWLRMAWSDIHHNLILLGEGFWFNVSFHGADNSRLVEQNTWGHAFNLDPQRDYGVQKTSPKPVVPAYAVMSRLLEGHKTAGAIEWLGDAVTGYAYERDRDVILALWSDEPCEVHVPVGVGHVDVVDWMGNAAPVACPQDVLTLALTRDPRYVKGVSPELWGTHGRGKPLRIEGTRVRALPGEHVVIRCQLRAPGTEELRGQLVCKPAQALQMASVAQDVRVPPGQTVEETFTLELPWHTAPGEYPLSLILTDGTSPCAGAGVTLLVEPAVEITAVTPAVVAGGYGANVTLQAPHARRAEGELTVAPSAAGLAEQHGRFSLSAGAAATHTFGWTTDGAPPYGLQADLKAVTADGVTASSTCDFDFLPAAWMPRSPVIDGHLNDWGTTTAVAVEPKRMGDGADSEIDPADFSSRVRVGWNQHALFVACEVTDDQHCQGASQLNFLSDEDSLLLAVNLDPLHATVAGGERVEGGVLRRWQELVFALSETDPKGARAGRVGSYDLRFAPCGDLEQKGVSQAIVRDGTTTTYEIALPWELLGDQNFPDTGDAVGFALLVRDLDVVAGDRRSQIAPLFGGVLPPRDVSRYGWVLLMQS